MSEAVREVSQRPATRAELLFEVRALDARLNACQAGLSSMSITWFSRPRSSEMTSRVSSSGTLRLPEKLVPTVRNDHRIRRDGAIDDELHLSFVAGIDHNVRHSRDVACPYPQQVSRALPVRVDNPVKIILYDILGTDRVGQLRQQLIADQGAGIGGRRATLGRWGVFTSRSMALITNGRKAGLSS